MIKRLMLAAVAASIAGSASAGVPLFPAKCGAGITADSNPQGQVYINGKAAKVTKRPDGQISSHSAGVWVDITPRGDGPPRVTYTAKDKSVGECEILSFKAEDRAPSGAAPTRVDSSERGGRGDFDANGPVKCAEGDGVWQQCNAEVARDGGGTATVAITRPDGGKRFIFFERGKAIGADLSQADGSQHFKVMRQRDLYLIEAGDERYELFEALIHGG